MGLRIVYGRAGSGKSEFIYNEIDKKLKHKENCKMYIITPEQFSFTAEQKLMENRKSIINAEVITFNRLAYRISNEIGRDIHTNLSKCGKAMMIYSILQSKKNELIFLNKSEENIDLCLRTISEFKKHGIKIEKLKEENEKIRNKYLKNKLNDMILIYEEFQKKIENKYLDETDLLTILAENIDKSNLMKNSEIYIDEFSGFTEQEYLIIKKLIKLSNNLTITVCADNLDFDTNPNIDIFYTNKITIKKIINLLDKNEKIDEINLENLFRFKSEELKYIEKCLFNQKVNIIKNEVENMKLFLAKNQYSEIEYVAKKINKLIKEEKYRYKEIGIITKNIEKYSGLTRAIFAKYNIPVFIDEKRDLNQNIIIQYVLSILEIFNKNYSYESIFNYLKLGFLDDIGEDIFKFEKYCIKYGIKGAKFKRDFIYGINENNKEEINYLNELRKKIINPLNYLEHKIKENKNSENIIKEFYLFLINEKIEEKLNKKIKKLEESNFYDLATEYQESYRILINILDEMSLIFKNEKIKIDKFIKILKIGFKNSGLGRIPANQDQVILGDVDRSRSHKVKAIFIIGLNDGVFPSINKSEGFFDDEDREFLKQEGIELAKGTLENLYDDNFNIYKAFTTSEEKLYLSYASSDGEGKSIRPSNLILKIKKVFPDIIEESDIIQNEEKIEIINEEILFENLILKINKIKNGEKISNEFLNIFEYFKLNEKYKNILNENLKYINYNFYENIKKENIEKIYGNNIKTSVSQLEKYNTCPFSYYLKYILKLKEKEEFKIQSFDTGSFMHEIIDKFFEEINCEKLNNITDEEIEKIIQKIINEKLLKINNYIFTATEKYKLLVERLKRIIIKSLKYIIQTLVQSEFKLQGTEVEFSEKGKYKPIILNLEDGKTIEIIGKIDRIDIAEDSNHRYVRIIDYKSSVKNIKLDEVYGGLQLQLITYLDAVCKIEDFVPAGVLYFNLLEQMISEKSKIREEEIEKKIKANFKMKGLILSDANVIKMHDKNLNSGYSSLVPVMLTKDGTPSLKRSSVVTKEEFDKLQKYTDKTIKQIAKEILNGKIELKPYYKDRKTPCEYCSYKTMCGFNSGICKKNYRYIDSITKEELFEKI